MRAIAVRDRESGLSLVDLPYPHAAENDVVVRVHAAGFTPGELDWPGTWTDRAGRDRTPSVPGHELSGEVVELGYGTTGLTVGQRVFGLADWARNGTLAEYVAVEARNLAPLAADIEHTLAAALPGFDPRPPARENLRAVFTVLGQLLAGETAFPGLAVIAGLLGDPLLRNLFVEAIVSPRLRVIESILDHAVQSGEIAADALRPMAAQTGPALIMQAFLLTGAPPTPADLDRILDSVLPAR